MVGMRPLERSLEKLDEVRKKKLSEMIGTSGSAASGTGSGVLHCQASFQCRGLFSVVLMYFVDVRSCFNFKWEYFWS